MNELTLGTKDAAQHPGNYSVESKWKDIGEGGRSGLQRSTRQLFRVMEIFYGLVLVVITCQYMFKWPDLYI